MAGLPEGFETHCMIESPPGAGGLPLGSGENRQTHSSALCPQARNLAVKSFKPQALIEHLHGSRPRAGC